MDTKDKKVNPNSGHRQRVFEKVTNFGFESFHEYELLEFILFAADPRKDTKPTAKMLLSHFSNIKNVLNATKLELKELGCTDRIIAVLACYKETVYRYNLQANDPGGQINSIDAAKRYIKALCGNSNTEQVYCIYLTPSKKIISTMKIAEGSQSSAAIYAEDIVRDALRLNAKYIIIGHNHPSGLLAPSRDDLIILHELSKGLNYVRIFLYDSIIATESDATSLLETGYIKNHQIDFTKIGNILE